MQLAKIYSSDIHRRPEAIDQQPAPLTWFKT